MHFMIYIPERNAKPERLADLGLPGLVDGAFAFATSAGPGGVPGTIFGWRPDHGKNAGRLLGSYDAASQTWMPSVAGNDLAAGRYSVGYLTKQPPTPEDLMRRYPFRGTKVELAEPASEWWLPSESDLPYDCKLQDDGSWKFIPQRRFDAFCAAASGYRQLIAPEEEDARRINPVQMQLEARDFVANALSINYRICPEIENALGLWISSRSGTILPAFLSILKLEWTFL